MRKLLAILFVILIAISLVGQDSTKNRLYNKAIRTFEAGDYEVAKVMFEWNRNYKDTANYLKIIEEKLAADKAANR
jgi:hypothetical protein